MSYVGENEQIPAPRRHVPPMKVYDVMVCPKHRTPVHRPQLDTGKEARYHCQWCKDYVDAQTMRCIPAFVVQGMMRGGYTEDLLEAVDQMHGEAINRNRRRLAGELPESPYPEAWPADNRPDEEERSYDVFTAMADEDEGVREAAWVKARARKEDEHEAWAEGRDDSVLFEGRPFTGWF